MCPILLSAKIPSAQVASKPGVTVAELQREFASWEEGYDASSAAAGPAKRRLLNEFVRGTYQQLVANVEHAQSQRLQEAERRAKEVHCNARSHECHAGMVSRGGFTARSSSAHIDDEAYAEHGGGSC